MDKPPLTAGIFSNKTKNFTCKNNKISQTWQKASKLATFLVTKIESF